MYICMYVNEWVYQYSYTESYIFILSSLECQVRNDWVHYLHMLYAHDIHYKLSTFDELDDVDKIVQLFAFRVHNFSSNI